MSDTPFIHDPACSPDNPCATCVRNLKALETMDEVYETAAIAGLMAITWRDLQGKPLEKDGQAMRGLPESMAKDFWTAYNRAKKESLLKIQATMEEAAVAKAMEEVDTASQAVAEADAKAQEANAQSSPAKESAPALVAEVLPAQPIETNAAAAPKNAKERRKAAREAARLQAANEEKETVDEKVMVNGAGSGDDAVS